MKKQYILPGFILLLFWGCIDDESNPGLKQISRIEFKTTFETEAYREDRWNEFRLACPEIVQTETAKPLSYRWDVNFKTVSTEKDLVYLCDQLTNTEEIPDDFPCRLTVSNEDGSSWLDFKLKVTSPYEEGVLVLSKQNEQTMLSFKREDKKGEVFQKYAYRLNNPQYPLGNEPKALLQHSGFVYIASENPIKIVKIDYKTFETKVILNYPTDRIDFMLGTSDNFYNLIFLGDGRSMEFDAGQNGIMNMFQQTIDAMYPGIKLAGKAMRIYSSPNKPVDMLTYNDTDGMLFVGEYFPQELFPEEFSGKQLIDLIPCRSGQEALVVVQTSGQNPDIVYLNPTIPTLFSSHSTDGSGISADSKFLASNKRSVLYYSVGNQIFRYDYTTAANFPQTADYTVGENGDVIQSMVFNPDESKLYVAYNTASGEFKGCVKCFVLSGDDTPWEEKGVAGEIVQMIYKK